MKHFHKLWIFIILSFLLIIILLAPLLRSLLFMSVWSHWQKKDSLLSESSLSLSIPGGLSTSETDWYPLVLTYCADSDFQRRTGNDSLRLTVLYNFPAFSLLDGCSSLYDSASPYYCSFYGAYVVKATDGSIYGFEKSAEGKYIPRLNEIAEIPAFDYQTLVLGSFGLAPSDFYLDWQAENQQKEISYAGYDHWYSFDAVITTNGVSHTPAENVPAYLQYGRPMPVNNYGHFQFGRPMPESGCSQFQYGSPIPVSDCDFPLTTLYCRIYGQYFPTAGLSIFFYIVAADPVVLDHCDTNILSNSRLSLS